MLGTPIAQCRICESADLELVLDLGVMALTGVFPQTAEENVPEGPLQLVRCRGACGLVQLRHTYDGALLYGSGYGYRSGLNPIMAAHLRDLAGQAVRIAHPKPGDVMVDIGSNDGTLLGHYDASFVRIGIDPTGTKFSRFYAPGVELVPEFFSADAFHRTGASPAKIVTSVAMFYDLEAPLAFAQQVASILDDEGIWVLEQSYLPSMLRACAYDTVCHEHVEYYGLRQIEWLADRAGLRVVDVEFNDTNGGSFRVIVAKKASRYPRAVAKIDMMRSAEHYLLDHRDAFGQLRLSVTEHRDQIRSFLDEARKKGQTVLGYGASTKGNVLLQFCGVGPGDVAAIAERNEDKFGRFTPGTRIPIISEAEARARQPAYMLVLPWHFRDAIVQRERDYLLTGGSLVFPLPHFNIVRA